MKKLLKYAKPYLWHIVITTLASIGCSVANVWIIDLLKQVIDESLQGDLVSVLPMLVLKALCVIIAGMLSNYFVVSMTGFFGTGILRDLRRDFVNHIMKMSPDFMEKNNFGDMIERASSDVETLAGYMQNYFKDCMYAPIIVIVFAIYLITLNPLLAAVCLGPLVIMVPLSIWLLKPVKIAQFTYVKRQGLTNNNIQEVFDGADVMKSYNLQKNMQDKYYSDLKETLTISNRNDLWQYNIEPLSCLIREAPTAIALCLGGYLAFRGYVQLGTLVAFMSGIGKINEPLVGAYQLVVRTQMAMISVKRIFEIMEMPVEDTERKLNEINQFSKQVFTFNNVSFAYSCSSETEHKTLEHFDLTVDEGTRIALVGRSGCGKSTIIKLMCRQYEADEGTILFYGNNFSEVNPEAVRNNLALISQDTVIFPMSILDNIRIGKPEANREEIIDAAKKAGCDDFVRELPMGYDTPLEEQGGNLSGGQRQRISIARAILKDAPILLLDEPTSALDKDTEQFVNNTLTMISQNKTVITVAHRLSTITDYDNIIVLEEGQIVETGTHEALMKAGGRYCKMYQNYVMSGGANA
ncbi:MAG: ABC transporter ATP-binding protein/permease [Lachnospiraceae bacterium]|nr:ABC transporter ATP-binding protein/permease [Lachnospiraceae bacterium]